MTEKIAELDLTSADSMEEKQTTDNTQIEDIPEEVETFNRNLGENGKMDSNEHWQSDDAMKETEGSGGSLIFNNNAYNHDDERDPIKSYESKPFSHEIKPKHYDSKSKEYELKPKKYESMPKQYESTLQKYESKPKQYESKPKQYESKPKQYESKPKQYESKPKQYESKPKQYESKPKQYESKPKQYDSKPKQYKSKPKQYKAEQKHYNKSYSQYESKSKANSYNRHGYVRAEQKAKLYEQKKPKKYKNKPTPYSEGSQNNHAQASTKSYRSGWDYQQLDDQNKGGSLPLLQELFGREPRYLRKH